MRRVMRTHYTDAGEEVTGASSLSLAPPLRPCCWRALRVLHSWRCRLFVQAVPGWMACRKCSAAILLPPCCAAEMVDEECEDDDGSPAPSPAPQQQHQQQEKPAPQAAPAPAKAVSHGEGGRVWDGGLPKRAQCLICSCLCCSAVSGRQARAQACVQAVGRIGWVVRLVHNVRANCTAHLHLCCERWAFSCCGLNGSQAQNRGCCALLAHALQVAARRAARWCLPAKRVS